MYIKVGIIIQQRRFKCIKEVPQWWDFYFLFFLSALRQWQHKAYNLTQCVNMHAYNTHMHTYNTHTHTCMHAHLYVCTCRHTCVCVGTGTNRTVTVKDTVQMKYCVRRTCIEDIYEQTFLLHNHLWSPSDWQMSSSKPVSPTYTLPWTSM